MIAIGALGKMYADGESIALEGEKGNCMYIVQQGTVAVVTGQGDREVLLSTLGPGDVFGEMSLFTGAARSATVRAKGSARVLTIDKRGFLKRVHEDPSLAFQVLRKMSERIHELNQEVARLRREQV